MIIMEQISFISFLYISTARLGLARLVPRVAANPRWQGRGAYHASLLYKMMRRRMMVMMMMMDGDETGQLAEA